VEYANLHYLSGQTRYLHAVDYISALVENEELRRTLSFGLRKVLVDKIGSREDNMRRMVEVLQS